MSEKKYHIAFNIDSNYVRHCSVTMASIFKNNPGCAFTVHILADSLTACDREVLADLATRFGQSVSFHEPDRALLDGFAIRRFSKRITMATYFRCLLSDILPAGIDRVLYLDCDIVVLGDLRPLFETPLEGVGVAAVADIGCDDAGRYEVLQYPAADGYFNAGVLMVNLDFWRRHGVPRRCVEYYHKYPERILFNDQDLLNSVLHGHKRLVDLRWNVQDGHYRASVPPERRAAWRGALLEPVVLHYTNRKPWNYDSQHPLRGEYARYLDLTRWRGDYPWRTAGSRLRRLARLLPFYLGLRKPKYVSLDALRDGADSAQAQPSCSSRR